MRVLICSGGGSKGAHSVGIVKALLEARGGYDICVGTSVGALIASFLAQYNKNEQPTAVKELERIWLELGGNNAVYKNHAPSFLTYLWALWKGGIYNMSPLRDIISKNLDLNKLKNSDTSMRVGVVSLNSGKFKAIDKSNEKIIDYIWASCIFPILFSPANVDGEMWVDGGIRDQIPLSEAFKFRGVSEIDVVLTSPSDGHIHDTMPSSKFMNVINVAQRGAGIMSDEIYINDLHYCEGPNAVKVNIWEPSKEVNRDSFKFDKTEIETALRNGYVETITKLHEIKKAENEQTYN